nr:UDP-N-acetylglucosamine transferase subunit ALG14 homolog isoform X2 [Anolis sagrei ordinatus]
MNSFHAMLATVAAAALLLLLLLLFMVRFFPRKETHAPRKSTVKLLAVAGSGGHTTEILRLLGSLSQAYCPRHYILADTDKMSEDKICSFEQKRAEMFSDSLKYTGNENKGMVREKSHGNCFPFLLQFSHLCVHQLFQDLNIRISAEAVYTSKLQLTFIFGGALGYTVIRSSTFLPDAGFYVNLFITCFSCCPATKRTLWVYIL